MTRNLTEGRIMPLLIKFAIPLVLGNIFQLTYNAVDSIIVGRFVGPGALAAVGSCNPLTTLVILILNGLCIGAGVLMGNEYGAGKIERLERQISTTAIAGTAFSAVLTAAFIIFARPILGIMQVDGAIMDMAVRYMRIIFVGLIFTFLYNFLSSTLRALGDSMTPLFFLIGSSVLNILGDILFVVVFNMGSEGCAISTVISEALCCLGCIIYIRLRIPILVLGRKWLVFDRSLLGPTVSYGWASAMQQGTVQLGKIGIQAIVNSIGVFVAAAFTAVNRLDDFTYMPQQNIAHAITAFMAQNHGAEREDRVLEGFKKGMILEVIYAGIVCFVSFVFARPLMRLFGDDPEVIAHGVRYLRLIAFMYIMPAFTNGIQGYFRGVGRLKLTLAASMINMGTRVGTAAVLVIGLGLGIEALPWSYFAGWVGMLCLQVPILAQELKKRSSARSS
ncbi:MAG: MATE family efflux transporter [Lachnospiraceae bacterium]|nr:MATE family efflux transporter [Lachnospiraceae bacterium]